jgi:hypothetical protein
MLRNVLEDYLNSVKEREFDYPLMSLLNAMGFYDIHVTDGGSEFGKDFIAKRTEEGVKYQYTIQSKRGDINQPDFRNKIMGQLLEAIVLKRLSHAQLDTALPQRFVLVTTGELKDNAFLELRELNYQFKELNKEEVEFWGKNRLIEFSEEYGFTGIHQTTAKGISGYAQFYLSYSKAIDGTLSDREIEELSQFWLDVELDYKRRILKASLEAEIIGAKLLEGGHLYEAIFIQLSLARMIMQVTYENDDAFVIEILKELTEEAILPLCQGFFRLFKADWEQVGRAFSRLCFRDAYLPMVNYLVWCARILEVCSLYFFLVKDQVEKDELISFLVEFIEKEPGCGHPPSDRYSISLVWSSLALLKSGKTEEANNLVKRGLVWLCDRTEKGFGLAHYEANEYEETKMLLGCPFDFMQIERNRSSFMASVVCDLAALLGSKEFYADVVNDIEACEIAYNYWQFPDTASILHIYSKECVRYPNVPHQFSIDNFEDFKYAEHIKHETSSFQIARKTGGASLILVSVLLKDRYFPKTWKSLIAE